MTTAPTLLNQILAIEKGVKATAARVLTDAYQQLQKPAPLTGILRSYRPRDDEGERLPEERTEVKVRVGEELAKVRAAHARMFDLMLTKDLANTRAKSDIVVDGQTLLTDVPVTTMLTTSGSGGPGTTTRRPMSRLRGRPPAPRR
jgi:hypothetical protein